MWDHGCRAYITTFGPLNPHWLYLGPAPFGQPNQRPDGVEIPSAAEGVQRTPLAAGSWNPSLSLAAPCATSPPPPLSTNRSCDSKTARQQMAWRPCWKILLVIMYVYIYICVCVYNIVIVILSVYAKERCKLIIYNIYIYILYIYYPCIIFQRFMARRCNKTSS